MSNLALIRQRRHDFRTNQRTDWLEGLPILGQPSAAGVVAGAANAGTGSLSVAAVDVGASEGVHVVAITGTAGGLTLLTVTDPDGDVTGEGVVGLPLYAAGLTLTLAQVAGQPALGPGDTFAVAVLPEPIDITGLTFELDSRLTAASATYALRAFSAPRDEASPTIVAGTTGGNLAMRVLRPAMARCTPSPPGGYPYAILAADPATGLSVPAFVGVIHHTAIPTPEA